MLFQSQRETPGSKVQFLAIVQVVVQAQQEAVVTQFQSSHLGPTFQLPNNSFEAYRWRSGGVLVVARTAW